MNPREKSTVPFKTLPRMIRYVFNNYRNAHAFNYKVEGEWCHMSTEVFLEKVRRMALGLRAMGVEKGECVGIIAKPSPHWLIADLAIGIAGGISVPMFPHVSPEHFLFQVSDSDMKRIFVIDSEHWPLVGQHQNQFSDIIIRNVPVEGERITEWNQVMRLGDTLSEQDPELYVQLAESVTETDIATIIYTSGSTGIPKGVELTHENFCSQLCAAKVRFPLHASSDRALSALPLAHVFERTLMYFYISSGVTVFFSDNIKKVAEDYKDVQPTITAVVPRLLEKVYAGIEAKVATAPPAKQKLARWALDLAAEEGVQWMSGAQKALADKLVYHKLREIFGGRLRAVICGGAPLQKKLCSFFWNIGVPIFQGYGLTETSPVLTCNFPGHNQCGTVGLPYPGVEVRISPTGEVLGRGPNIMKGYHKRPEATSEAISSQGWFHTGDTGSIDERGYLTITGRIKEIFKTSQGKMVSPVPIEQGICKNPLIDMAMVIGEGKAYVTVLLFPDQELLRKTKEAKHEGTYTDEEFLDSPFIRQQIEKLLDQVNQGLNRWEQVRKYRWVAEPLTISGGELTPTLKIRRKIIAEKYHSVIEGMYQDTESKKETT